MTGRIQHRLFATWPNRSIALVLLFLHSASFAVAEEPRNPLSDDGGKAVLSGEFTVEGGAGYANVMQVLRDEFIKAHPRVEIRIVGPGDAFARAANDEETERVYVVSASYPEGCGWLLKKFPTSTVLSTRIFHDPLAIIVNHENPLKKLKTEEVVQIFFKKNGSADEVKWGFLPSLGQSPNDMPISINGRSINNAQTLFLHTFIRESDGMELRKSIRVHQGNSGIIDQCSSDRDSIGYVQFNERIKENKNIKIIPVSPTGSSEALYPVSGGIPNESYPLSRTVRVFSFSNGKSAKGILQHEFVNFLVSEKGKKVIANEGYLLGVP